ncbi:cobalt-precorrin-6A reductase [Kribbella sp. NPDC026611]|uniref:cobalt-precorrin-6A reductase n=1 Tax=Kribbella sp. NPDC026611 TaxID=3154911 RepID=UPI0033E1F081
MILVLGGTTESRQLAEALTGTEVITSLAGRTADLRKPVGQVRVGGFGGAEGLAAWLRLNPVDAVIDATHPFAAQITANAAAAARETGVPHLVLRRPGWTAAPGDTWHWTDSTQEAAALLPTLGKRVFLTIGRQGLSAFKNTGLWTLARCVDPPEPRPTWCTLLLARGPFAEADELALLDQHHIDLLVTKDSGGGATAAKLTAARRREIPVVLIRRPALPPGTTAVDSIDDVLVWLGSQPR